MDPPAVALGVEKSHNNVMDRPPRPVDESMPNMTDLILIFYLRGCNGNRNDTCILTCLSKRG